MSDDRSPDDRSPYDRSPYDRSPDDRSPDDRSPDDLYPYVPSKILPIVFAALVGVSLVAHTYQNFRYHFWRVTFFLFYANILFITGWILRAISAKDPSHLGLYIAETVFIYIGPPIYAAAEYNILGRLLHYLPMHSPLNPSMVKYFFIYLGALVEGLTAAGAAQMATSDPESDKSQSAATLLAVAVVLQGAIEIMYTSFVALVQYRAIKRGTAARNVNMICCTLYGCSFLVLMGCVFRAIETFNMYGEDCVYCGSITREEWYLYALEAAPMVLYTFWLNIAHPGRFLLTNTKRYLDLDGKTERMGPGWIDERPLVIKVLDPFNMGRDSRARGKNTQFWLLPERWPACADGAFALGSASNVGKANAAAGGMYSLVKGRHSSAGTTMA